MWLSLAFKAACCLTRQACCCSARAAYDAPVMFALLHITCAHRLAFSPRWFVFAIYNTSLLHVRCPCLSALTRLGFCGSNQPLRLHDDFVHALLTRHAPISLALVQMPSHARCCSACATYDARVTIALMYITCMCSPCSIFLHERSY